MFEDTKQKFTASEINALINSTENFKDNLDCYTEFVRTKLLLASNLN